MVEITSLATLRESLPFFENTDFMNRYISYEKVQETLLELPSFFKVKSEGKSVNEKPIYSVRFGTGRIKILMWSQMHGNETTTTKALLDVFRTFELAKDQSWFEEIFSNCSFLIVPILNPDGSIVYSRENGNRVDLNRDAASLSQPESQVLHKIFESFKPDFCFNLHDQRSIYGVGTTGKPAIVSFLAPSVNMEKKVNETRKTAMQLILEINDCLQHYIPKSVGRYNDSYNPNCVGDKFQSLGVPTLLFEAGHFPGDYQRNTTRNLIYLALFKAMRSIVSKTYELQDYRNYFEIPENGKSYFDIILRNVRINDVNTDVAIQYEERIKGQKIEFIPIIERVGDLSNYRGHRNFEFHGEKLQINHCTKIDEKDEINHISIGNKQILIDLTNY